MINSLRTSSYFFWATWLCLLDTHAHRGPGSVLRHLMMLTANSWAHIPQPLIAPWLHAPRGLHGLYGLLGLPDRPNKIYKNTQCDLYPVPIQWGGCSWEFGVIHQMHHLLKFFIDFFFKNAWLIDWDFMSLNPINILCPTLKGNTNCPWAI